MGEDPAPRHLPVARTPRQQRIHRRLGLIGEGPQAFYADILRIVNGEVMLASGSNLGGHLLREMESALRDALEPITQHRNVALRDTQTKNPGAERPSHASQIRAILKALGISETEGIGADWLDLATGNTPPHRIAHRTQFNRPSALSGFRETWERFEPVLDVALERFESRYGDLFHAVDALLAKPRPSNEDLDYLGQHLPNHPVIRFHFFEHLDHEGWLAPLQRRGYFRNPPPAVANAATKTISHSAWAPPLYLQRMAALPQCQEQVLEIVLALPDVDNFYVHDGIARVVERLPPALSVQVVPLLVRWLGAGPVFGLLPERVGALAVALGRAGYASDALALLQALLAIMPEETKSPSGRTRQRSAAVIEEYQYSQVLKESFPAVLELAPDATFEMVRTLLEQALAAGADSDYSWIWRRSIGQANLARRYDVRDLLIDAVRDAVLLLCRARPDQLTSLIARLESRPNSVHHRIAMFVLAELKGPIDLIEQRLLSKEHFDAWGQNAEYALLLRSAFSRLRPEVQETILGWIASAPEMKDETADVEQTNARRKGWQYRRLRVLEGQLSDEWARRLKEISPSKSQDEEESSAAWGQKSPLTLEQLRSMLVTDVAAYLRSWKPTSDGSWRGPSPGGLANVLTSGIAENPAGFSEAAMEFTSLLPTYVRSVLSGFVQALKESRSFSWRPVLMLCQWVVAQADGPQAPQRDWDQDPGWSWSRKTVAGLLRAGMDAEVNRTPIGERELVWKICEVLTWDPDPLPDNDGERVPESGLDLAVNSVRGEAMIAAVRYGVWVKKHMLGESVDAFEHVPELRHCLEQHLDPQREPSIAIWAVLGESLPVLSWIDRSWTVANAMRIFTTPPQLLKEAAWANYVKWNPPYNDLFLSLRELYAERVSRLSPGDGAPDVDSAEIGLVRHLAFYYARGLDGADQLIDDFFRRAGAGARHEAIDIIGRDLGGAESLTRDVEERLKLLWERNVANAALVGADSTKVLQAFGWWLSSGKLDVEWSLQQAEYVLAVGATLEPDHVVIEYLETIAKDRPLEVARIVAGLVENIENEWSIHGWRDHAMIALGIVLASNDPAAVAEGRVAINRLVARGHTQYRNLLQ